MQLAVHATAECRKELVTRQVGQLIDPGVDGCRTAIDYASLIAEDARLHVVKVVLARFLKGGIVAFLLKLLRLEIVARVELVADGEGNDVQLTETVSGRSAGSGGTHRQHLQHRVLCAVVAVLGTSLTLGYPDVFLLLGDSIVDIAAHQLAGAHHLVSRQATTHGKRLVHTHQTLDPRIDEQVVANADLYRGGIAGLDQQHIEEGRVEHNVAMIADEGIALVEWRIMITTKRGIIEAGAVSMLVDDMPHDGFHEALLEIQRRLDPNEEQLQQPVAQSFGQPRHKAFQHDRELAVVQ